MTRDGLGVLYASERERVLCALAGRGFSAAEAEDALQTAAARLLERSRAVNPGTATRLLFVAAKHAAVDARRSFAWRRSDPLYGREGEPLPLIAPEPCGEPRDLRSLVNLFPPRLRGLVARLGAGMTLDEAARDLGWHPGTARSRFYRARAALERARAQD